MEFWKVPREWEGETVFIIAGGPSVTQEQVDKLKGRRVIAINSSCYIAPWADILFFSDSRWFNSNKDAIKKFAGRVVSVSNALIPSILHLRKVPVSTKDPVVFQTDPQAVTVKRTSLTGGINLGWHLNGGAPEVLLGADGKRGVDGRPSHHKPHEWAPKPGSWDDQRKDLEIIAAALKPLGAKIFNTNPDSAFRMFPFEKLEAFLT